MGTNEAVFSLGEPRQQLLIQKMISGMRRMKPMRMPKKPANFLALEGKVNIRVTLSAISCKDWPR